MLLGKQLNPDILGIGFSEEIRNGLEDALSIPNISEPVFDLEPVFETQVAD